MIGAIRRKKRHPSRGELLKEYELCEEFIASSSARYFQLQALVLTVVWGGFVLMVTETTPGPVENILVTSTAAAGAASFAAYWIIFANRARFQEEVMWKRAREIEEALQIERHTTLWALQRWDTPEVQRTLSALPDDRRTKLSELHDRFKTPGGFTRFPLGLLTGAAGVVGWMVLVARSFLVHFGWL